MASLVRPNSIVFKSKFHPGSNSPFHYPHFAAADVAAPVVGGVAGDDDPPPDDDADEDDADDDAGLAPPAPGCSTGRGTAWCR